MRMLLSIAAAALLLITSRPTPVDGSIATAELLETLSQSNPKLAQTLRDGFELDKDAQGGIIGRGETPGGRNPHRTLHAACAAAAGG